MLISYEDFEKVDIRIGTVLAVEDFPRAKNKSYKLEIDLGDLGIKKSSAQITTLYRKEDLIGKQVLCVINFPPKNIAGFQSEVLTMGFKNESGEVVLATSERKVFNGSRLF